ncbi:MAG: radical SAM protein [Patescibacteria group bacterium]|nr:radical SAM protein [Patescibacteria group bacterium]
MTEKEKAKSEVLPGGGLVGTQQLFGKSYIWKWIIRVAWSYRRTFFYLLRKKGVKAAFNFLYVKVFVPTGEGSAGAIYFLIGWLIRRFPGLAPHPNYIEMEMTTICNKRCIICEHTYWKPKDQEYRHLTFKEFKTYIDQFPKLKWVNLTGEGSAFLNPEYVKMLKYLKQKKVPIFLVDHLADMDKKTIEELVKMGIDGIYISIDGATKATYEKVKKGCDFDKVVGNLKYLVEMKKKYKSPIPELCFRFVITTENYKEIPDLVDLVFSIGNKKELGDGTRIDYCGLLSFKEIDYLKVGKIPKPIIARLVEKQKQYDALVLFAHVEAIGAENAPVESCISWMEPYIMMGGYVQPCCAVMMSNNRPWLREHAFGNLNEKSFKEIWHSDRYKRFRASINNSKKQVPLYCAGCRAFSTKERVKKYGIAKDL